MPVIIPPIKSQGIKSKLVPWLRNLIASSGQNVECWREPFAGTCAVALNIKAKKYVLSDANPHLINFYQDLKRGEIDKYSARKFLVTEGALLLEKGQDHYYALRERFNAAGNSLDFLFLSRACFNGMIRFNKKGRFNVPFCRKNERFRNSYITKICNQLEKMQEFIQHNNVDFSVKDFRLSLEEADKCEFVYCDPPYIGRYNDYFNQWTKEDEQDLYEMLLKCSAKFILSTWHHNKYRKNENIDKFWNKFFIHKKQHFYHIGARESNRNAMVEALVTNIETNSAFEQPLTKSAQGRDLMFFLRPAKYVEKQINLAGN